MKANDIRAELVRNNITIKSIAQGLGIAHPGVSQVISGLRKTKRIRQAIADAIGKPVTELWPE
jgi:lambda repressor-like predicted transcriptional regulator